MNIVYEKNLRLSKDNKLRVAGEIKEAFKQGYKVIIHVVFLNSYAEGWKRVQKRYEQIRRYVPKEKVKSTFQDLFPNLNKLVSEVTGEYHITLHYNGVSIKNRSIFIGIILIYQNVIPKMKLKLNISDEFFIENKTDQYHSILWKEGVELLPSSVKNRLKQVDFLRNML